MTNAETRIVAATEARDRADWSFEDSEYPRVDWQTEVGMDDTQLGYFDWVIHKLEAAIESGQDA